MKITAKILSVVLVLCMLFTTFGYAATYNDVTKENANFSAISLLSSLGIIKGYEDGTFGPDKNVTRAEFTVMLMRTLNLSNLGSNDPAGTPFTDIEVVKDWAVSDIKTAYDLGIINGMDEHTFAPNDNVTNEQALKMIVCAMGYEPMAVEIAGGKEFVWPAGYTTTANQLLITKGISSAYNAPAKRAEIAQYIFNALEVDLMKTTEYPNGAVRTEITKGINILNDKLKVLHERGQILADTESTSFDNGAVAREGEVIILSDSAVDHEIFYISDISTKGLVGRNIEYYYKENFNGEKTIIHIVDETKDYSVMEIDPESIYDIDNNWSTGGEILYWENVSDRKPTSVKISANPVVSINGRVADLSSTHPENVFYVDSGSIELINTDGTGVFNKINIDSYETFVIGSISSSSSTIVDMYNTARNIVLDAEDVRTTLSIKRAKDGSKLTFSSLKKNDVISVKTINSVNSKVNIEVVVSNEKVNGVINSIDLSEKQITVDEKVYKLSNYILNNAMDKINTLEVNDTCNFFLDKDGKIAAFDKAAGASAAYVYICGVAYEASEDVLTFKVIDNAGSRKTYTGANRIKIDGNPVYYYDAADVLDNIITNAGGNIDGATMNASQLVKLTKNKSNEVTEIDTIAPSANDSETNLKLSKSSTNAYTYKSSNKSFSSDSGDSFMIDSNTIVFLVPGGTTANGNNNGSRTDYTKYSKKTLSYFKDGDVIKNFEVYDLGSSSASKAKCLVIYGKQANTETVSERSSFIIVDKVKTVQNSTGGEAYEISGYIFGDGEDNLGEYTTIKTHNDNYLGDAKTGDMYSFIRSSSGNISSAKIVEKAIGVSANSSYVKDFSVNNKQKFTFARGLLDDVEGDTFVVADTLDINAMCDPEAYPSINKSSYIVTDETVVLTLRDSAKNDFLVGNGSAELMTFAKFSNFIDDAGNITNSEVAEADEIFVYIVDEKVVLIYKVIK